MSGHRRRRRRRELLVAQLVETLIALWTAGGDRCQYLYTLRADASYELRTLLTVMKDETELARDGATARLLVTDDGIGISAEAQARIFDRFYRADEARAHAREGTGLGLAICKWIAEAHHGRIEVQSTAGEGSHFTVVLPVTSP